MLMMSLLMKTHSDACFVAGCSKHAEGEGTRQEQRQDKGGKHSFAKKKQIDVDIGANADAD